MFTALGITVGILVIAMFLLAIVMERVVHELGLVSGHTINVADEVWYVIVDTYEDMKAKGKHLCTHLWLNFILFIKGLEKHMVRFNKRKK